jgi:hypothetical protein
MARDGRIGPVMPTEALSQGALNESTPLDQRVADRTTEMSAGPKLGENDSYMPARYERTWHEPATGKSHTVVIEDR